MFSLGVVVVVTLSEEGSARREKKEKPQSASVFLCQGHAVLHVVC